MSRNRVRHFDLRILAFLVASHAACATTYQRSYLVDSVSLPTSSSETASYAIDLNGDGHPDNNLGSFLTALTSMAYDGSVAMSAAISDGSIVHVVEQQSTDASFASDPAAIAKWYVGHPFAQAPLFDGLDQPSYDGNYAPGAFLAALSGGGFTSSNPATTTAPVSLTFTLQLGPDKVALPVQGARLSFITDNVGTGHMQGQLNGSIRHQDLMTLFPPALADLFNAIIQADPTSPTAMQLESIFDTGCNGGTGDAGDQFIEVCEVAGNDLILSLLAPDVQIRDANGNYAPNPANTTPDSNSLGIRFTAVRRERVFANGFDAPE